TQQRQPQRQPDDARSREDCHRRVMWTSERIVVVHFESVVECEIDSVSLAEPAIVASNGVSHDLGPPQEAPDLGALEALITIVTRRTHHVFGELLKGDLAIVPRKTDMQVGNEE